MNIIERSADPAAMDAFKKAGIHPVLARLYATRGLTPDTVRPGIDSIPDKRLLPGCMEAGAMLADAIMNNEKIVIIGDFDADGATSTALMLRAIRDSGGDVDFIVPSRITDGYGLTPPISDRASELGCKLLVTVDNGISAFAGIDRAVELGMQVLVTDHHLQGEALPAAHCIVNPNTKGNSFPTRALAGVGVAFYVAAALREVLRDRGWSNHPNLSSLLDLVAVGTVGDLVPLDATNRALVNLGIERIRADKCCVGIRAMIEVAQKNCATVTSEMIAFTLAPRINACGRMSDMSLGIRMLSTDDGSEAVVIARELEAINAERKTVQKEMTDLALNLVAALPKTELGSDTKSVVVHDKSFHEGVVGLVASRLKEEFHLPSAAFALAHDGSLKGSFRSIPGVHVRDVVDLVSKRTSGLILSFGGHAMACGCRIRGDGLEEFRKQFDACVTELAAKDAFTRIINTDGPLDSRDLTVAVADMLAMENWGQGFPAPVFEGRFAVINQKTIGDGKHLKMTLCSAGGVKVDAIQFGRSEPVDSVVQALFTPSVNEYRGERSLQIMVADIMADKPALEITRETISRPGPFQRRVG